MIRFGLCCIFRKEPIKFRRTTAKYLQKFSRNQQLKYLAEICRTLPKFAGTMHKPYKKPCDIVGITTLRIFGSTARYSP